VPNPKGRENVLAVVIALFRRKTRDPNSLQMLVKRRDKTRLVRHEIRPCCVERRVTRAAH
jgi:hypothetical protein